MKKNINDYKETKTAIEVNSIEEFDRIKELLGHTKQKGERCFKENENYISCYSDDYCDKQYWINAGFTLYKASDFLEEELEFDTKKLIIGEIYYKHNFIFDHVSKINYSRNNTAISITEKAFFNKNAAMSAYNEKPERLATDEEKKWLNTCITQDKFIPKEDLHLYDDSGLLVKTNEKMKSILEEAKERYPIGTKFKCVKDSELAIVEQELKEDDQGFIYTQFQGNRFHQFVYAYDKWAEIVSLPNEESYKIGDWIVITQDVREKGMIFKIKSQFKDIVGRWRLENSQYSYSNDQIRKATEEEIEQVINKKKEWIPIISNCIMYNGEDISKGFEVSLYTKKPKKLQTITIESTTDLNLNLTKIKSKQIQTIKI